MIPYRKLYWGLHMVLRCYGSAVLHTTIFGLLAVLQTILLYKFWDGKSEQYFAGAPSFTFPAYTGLVTFLIVFRQSFSSGRYDNGRTYLQNMSAALTSAVSAALCFDGGRKRFKRDPDDPGARAFCADLVHACSLLHACSLQALRRDWDIDNLTAHDENVLPPWDSASTPGFKVPFYAYVFPRNRLEYRARFHKVSKLQVVGGVSSDEREALVANADLERSQCGINGMRIAATSCASTFEPKTRLWTSDSGPVMRGAMERPYRLLFWVEERLRMRITEGGLDMPEPLLTAVWTPFSVFVQNFELATSLNDTPFPFPWAQLIVVSLLTWQFLIPFTVVVSYQNRALGVVISAVTVWTLWALNEVARDIEDPYLNEPNDLPIPRLQYQFNERLMALAASAQGKIGLKWGDTKSRHVDAALTEVRDVSPPIPPYAGGIGVMETGVA